MCDKHSVKYSPAKACTHAHLGTTPFDPAVFILWQPFLMWCISYCLVEALYILAGRGAMQRGRLASARWGLCAAPHHVVARCRREVCWRATQLGALLECNATAADSVVPPLQDTGYNCSKRNQPLLTLVGWVCLQSPLVPTASSQMHLQHFFAGRPSVRRFEAIASLKSHETRDHA